MYASILVALSLVLSPAPGVCRSAPPSPSPTQPDRLLLPPGPGPRPAPAPAAKRDALAPTAAIAIDTATAGEEGELMRPRIKTMVAEAMKAFNIAEGQGEALPQVEIKVSELGEDAIGWSYSIDVRHGSDQAISGGSVRGQCADCLEKELVEKVGNDARLALQQLRVYIDDYNAQVEADNEAVAKAAAAGTNAGGAGQGAAPASNQASDVDAPPMHSLCKAGIGLMAGGVIGVGVGIGLALMPDRQISPAVGYEFRSTALPGYVTLGIGGAAALAGVVLFVVGHRKSRAPNTALVPSFGGGMAGLQWSGRF